MASLKNQGWLLLRASHELGFRSVWLNALYRLGLKTGYWLLRTPPRETSFPININTALSHFALQPPAKEDLSTLIPEESSRLLENAEQICNGKVHLYHGSSLTPIQLSPPLAHVHWSKIPEEMLGQDIKDIWEAARFSWVFTLLRAYTRYGNERFAAAFWQCFETFFYSNPVNLGPNWVSGQEIALRLITWVIAGVTLKNSVHTTEERLQLLARSIFAHARRIPSTLIYARAQNNNHLLVEAAGLYTAGVLFHPLPEAKKWQKQGWHWLNRAFQNQILTDGSYCQNSINYHRVMLQIALWVRVVAEIARTQLPTKTLCKLASATRWLLAHIDPISGQVPNLGHNDGAYIFPLSECNFSDYRPVAQACGRAFLNTAVFPPGPWDEMSLWFGLKLNLGTKPSFDSSSLQSRGVYKLGNAQSWATIRVTHHTTRPAHADQLHFDLWWQGHNIAKDPGTYRYNAPPPWQNILACTAVHNTIEIDYKDQMLRAGKFLWLRWSQGQIINYTSDKIVASHTGYNYLGILHQREIYHPRPGFWKITDTLLPRKPQNSKRHTFVLHWLLPDAVWELSGTQISLTTPYGKINLEVTISSSLEDGVLNLQVIRAGEKLTGSGPTLPHLGWYSPTYGEKNPALSYRAIVSTYPPLTFQSTWELKLE